MSDQVAKLIGGATRGLEDALEDEEEDIIDLVAHYDEE
jgi:hypothetical protein